MLWPVLPYEEWKPTRDTLHMQLQVIGKVRLALSPMEPEWAHVALYVTARGLTTSPIPHPTGEVFDINVDLLEHRVDVRTGAGRLESVPLRAEPVAEYYRRLMAALERAEVPVEISTLPSEVPDPIPFPDDTVHASYDAKAVTRFHRTLLGVDAVLREFRARFYGKTPPVQLWWGTLDLAVSLYSGRPLTPPSDAGVIARLGGDEEHYCAGFWQATRTRRARASSPTCIRSRTASSARCAGATSAASSCSPTTRCARAPTRAARYSTSLAPRSISARRRRPASRRGAGCLRRGRTGIVRAA